MNAEIELEVEILLFTDKAIMIENLKGKNIWISKSQITDFCGDSKDTAEIIFIPEWLATQLDLI